MNPAVPNRNWYYVYLLRSSKTQWIYSGLAGLKLRLGIKKKGRAG